nr:MAG TPA: hypothetical protein [Caudoviricetes sp.]
MLPLIVSIRTHRGKTMTRHTNCSVSRILKFTTLRADFKVFTNWNVISSGFIKFHIMSPPLME